VDPQEEVSFLKGRVNQVEVRSFWEKERVERELQPFKEKVVYASPEGVASGTIFLTRSSPARFARNLSIALEKLPEGGILVISPPARELDPEEEVRVRELIDRALKRRGVRIVVLKDLRPAFGSVRVESSEFLETTEVDRLLADAIPEPKLRRAVVEVVKRLSPDEIEAFREEVSLFFPPYRILKTAYDAVGRAVSGVPGVRYLGIGNRELAGYWELGREIYRLHERGSGVTALLSGVPGTGKTLFAYWYSKESTLPLYEFNPLLVRDSYFGRTEEKVRRAVEALKKVNLGIVLIDEYDKAVVPPEGPVASALAAVKRELLDFLEEESMRIVFATANDPSGMTPEELRRFKVKAFFNFPSGEQGVEILKLYLPGWKPSEEEEEAVKKKIHRLFTGSALAEIAGELDPQSATTGEILKLLDERTDRAVSFRLKNEHLLKAHSAGGFVQV